MEYSDKMKSSCTDPNTFGSAICARGFENLTSLIIEDASVCCCGKIKTNSANEANIIYNITITFANFTNNKSYDTPVIYSDSISTHI